ncbi:MAG: spore protease YyaC [Clostridiales bacterium]|nr:spore protease YyaC [Clostridiales bacterium]
MQEYNFNVNSTACVGGLARDLSRLLQGKAPVILCIGSDAVIGDSLSPMIGSFLKEFYRLPAYIYGELAHPVTAKELPLITQMLKKLHPTAPVIAIDACVGSVEEIGLIKLKQGGVYPGKGVGKHLSAVGDIALMGVVAPRGENAFQMLEVTRLRLVYRMAEKMASAIYGAVFPLLSALENPSSPCA